MNHPYFAPTWSISSCFLYRAISLAILMPGEASRTQDVEEVVVLRDFAQSLLEIGIPLLLLDLLQVHQDEVGVVCLIMANRDFLVLVGLAHFDFFTVGDKTARTYDNLLARF